MPSWEIKLRDKETGRTLALKTDGSPVVADREFILPGTNGHLLTQEHLANPANFPNEFLTAIKGDTGEGIESIVFIATSDVSGIRGKAGASDTYQISLSNGVKSDFIVTNGQTNAEITTIVQAALETVIGSAPAALDTLSEIAAAIGNNADFYNSVIQAIALKADSNSVYDKGQIDNFVASLKTIPQNPKVTAYTLALTDGGNSIDTNSNVTIPTATTTNFAIGTTINVTNISSASINVVPAAGVTLNQSGTTVTGALALPPYTVAVLRKVASDTWYIAELLCLYSKSEIDAFVASLKTIPQVLKSAAYTLALTDGGGAVDTTAGVTVPANASVAFPIGSIITVTNTSAVAIVITQSAGVTLRQAATANTGNRTLAAYGVCSIRKIAADTWVIAGAGIS